MLDLAAPPRENKLSYIIVRATQQHHKTERENREHMYLQANKITAAPPGPRRSLGLAPG